MQQLSLHFPDPCRPYPARCWFGIWLDDNGRNDSVEWWRWNCEETS